MDTSFNSFKFIHDLYEKNHKILSELKRFAFYRGISLFGTSRFNPDSARLLRGETALKEGLVHTDKFPVLGKNQEKPDHLSNILVRPLEDYPVAISMGLRLARGVFDTITDRPTRLYFWHYRQANYILDRTAFELALMIEKNYRHRAVPIAASQIIDWENMLGHLSHKHVAQSAGLGYIGRNNLLVNPLYGAQVRYVTVLTDLQVEEENPEVAFGCGTCKRCVENCPAKAIAMTPKSFDHHACMDLLKTFTQKGGVGQFICGVCQKHCYGESSMREEPGTSGGKGGPNQ